MDAETPKGTDPESSDDDFITYLALRLGVETREARERLSAWLTAYEPPPQSGVRRAAPDTETADEIKRSA